MGESVGELSKSPIATFFCSACEGYDSVVMAVTDSELQDAHNRGQKDGFNNKYDPPLNWIKGSLGFANEDEIALKEAYDAGYEHGRSQR